MMEFLVYDGKVAVALLVFYLFYRFLLKKETFHRFNRVVLVGTAVLSFLLPLCIITIHKPIEVEPVVPEPAIIATDLPAQELAPLVETAVPWWPIALILLFWVGVVFVLTRVLISILSIVRIIRRGELVREEEGCQIIVTERDIDPFSWMKYIVLSRKDWEAPHESILAHEKAHIGLKHSREILLVDILSALQWFNPAIWMLRADLQELHEYEADDAVLRSGTNIKEYQYLLIRKAVSKSGYSVANSFNHSILKNRITMMSKSKSPLSRGWRVLYLLPLVCLGLGLQARTVFVPVDKDSENNEAVQDTLSERVRKKTTLNEVTVVKYANPEEEDIVEFFLVDPETMPSFQGGDANKFAEWVNQRLIYPKNCTHSGTMKVRFTVGSNGSLRDIKVIESVCPDLDAAVITVVAQSPKWTPATNNGKAVPYGFTLPFNFIRRESGATKESSGIVLNVRADGMVESGGQVYTRDQIKDIVPAHKSGDPLNTVQIVAGADVPMGVINDVKQALRGIESLKVRYAMPADQNGVTRYMAPLPKTPTADNKKYGVTETFPGVNRENVFVVRINSNDKFFFGDAPRQDDAEMLRVGKDFLREHGKESRFALRADRGTSFGAYVHMQNLLLKIYEEVRSEKAQSVYGKPLEELSAEERSQINSMVPLSISETEMKGR